MVKIKIERSEVKDIKANPGWSLIYGRRKVGKTFMLKNYVPYDIYFSVRIDRSVSCSGLPVSEFKELDDFKRAVTDSLTKEKTVVVDGFQRLPVNILEDIAQAHPKGRLILTGSSMKVTKEIIDKKSPLLGLMMPYRLGLISPPDVLKKVSQHIGIEKAIEFGPLFSDP